MYVHFHCTIVTTYMINMLQFIITRAIIFQLNTHKNTKKEIHVVIPTSQKCRVITDSYKLFKYVCYFHTLSLSRLPKKTYITNYVYVFHWGDLLEYLNQHVRTFHSPWVECNNLLYRLTLSYVCLFVRVEIYIHDLSRNSSDNLIALTSPISN